MGRKLKMTAIKETSAVAYKRGLADGFKEYYNKGYEQGYKVGHTKGYEEGNDFGQDKSLGEGYDMGMSESLGEGYDMGMSESLGEGYDMGMSEGYEAGLEDILSPKSVDDTAEELVRLLRDNPTINGSSNYLQLKTLFVGFLRDKLPPYYSEFNPPSRKYYA